MVAQRVDLRAKLTVYIYANNDTTVDAAIEEIAGIEIDDAVIVCVDVERKAL